MAINPPIELLDLPAEGELVTRVLRFEEGETVINPKNGAPSKIIPVLRLYVPPEDKAHAPPYWDVTSTTLHPSLRTYLPTVIAEKRWIRIRKFGVAPRARFQLEVYPKGDERQAFDGVRR